MEDEIVGNPEGSIDCLAVGNTVENDGISDGEYVGGPVGTFDGSVDGILLGSCVCLSVGYDVVKPEGKAVAESDGPEVGVRVVVETDDGRFEGSRVGV